MAGCGRYAGGQGYNSIGHFCGGWAGNCGDGGIGGSTWYLVCDRCREKYLREKQTAAREKVPYCCCKILALKSVAFFYWNTVSFLFSFFFFFFTSYWILEPNSICMVYARWSSQGRNLCKWRPRGRCPQWRPTRWFGQMLCSCCPLAVLPSPACCAITLPGPCIPSCFPASRRACRTNSPIRWAVSTYRH